MNKSIDDSNVLVSLTTTLPDTGKVSITEAIKSVVKHETSLKAEDIELTIDNLQTTTLFEPVLAYYSLTALQNKSPINFYNIFSSNAQEMGKSVSGLAHYDGKIEMKNFPASHQVKESITHKLFDLLKTQTEITPALFQQAGGIYFMEPDLSPELKNEHAFDEFLQTGLAGHTEGVLFHEITHQVMRELHTDTNSISFTSYYPYDIDDTESQEVYHSAICKTLLNIQAKYLPNNGNTCQNLWDFGLDLKNTLLGPNNGVDEGGMINVESLTHSLKFFGESVLGNVLLLSTFSTKLYAPETLDAEFIPRLPELEFIPYSSKDANDSSIAGRQYYCQYILPKILNSIENHHLHDRIEFDTTQDFGCEQVMGQQAEYVVSHGDL